MSRHLATGRRVDRAVAGLAALLERLPRRRPSLAILTYHRVAPAAERRDLHPGLRVDPEAFAAQVELLAARAHPVSVDDLLAAQAAGTALPTRAVHITLDDAYECVAHHAWPVLRAAGVPATLFVPTAYPDSGRTFWWDRLHHALWSYRGDCIAVTAGTWPLRDETERAAAFAALRAEVATRPHDEGLDLVEEVRAVTGAADPRPATAGWDTLRRLGAEGLALAPHSRTHPLLHRVPPRVLDAEVAGSWTDLEAAVGPAARRAFAHPGGGYDDQVLVATRRAGLNLVMTTERGVNDGVAPTWEHLRRINVGPRTSTGLVRIQLRPEAHRARAGASAARDLVSAPSPARGGRRRWS